jgi:hypothetical protein
MPLPFMMGAFPAGEAMASAPSGAAITLSGTLNATDTSSTINSTARTVTVPAGNSGIIRFTDLQALGDGAILRLSKNGGAYDTLFDGYEETFANSDTILLSAIGALNPGDGVQITLIDATNGSQIATHGTPQIYRV